MIDVLLNSLVPIFRSATGRIARRLAGLERSARPAAKLQASAVLVIPVYKRKDAGSEQAVRVAPIKALPMGDKTRSHAALA
jgi:hypothetical protein